MIAMAGLLLPVIGWQWTKDPQDAGHNQGPSDLGGHSPDGLQVHPPRVPKAPNRSESPTLGRHAGRPAARTERSRLTASLDQMRASDCQQFVSNDPTPGLARDRLQALQGTLANGGGLLPASNPPEPLPKRATRSTRNQLKSPLGGDQPSRRGVPARPPTYPRRTAKGGHDAPIMVRAERPVI